MEAGKRMDEIAENNDMNWNQMFADEIGTKYFFFFFFFTYVGVRSPGI